MASRGLAVVTGASRGIGSAIARHLAMQGYTVHGTFSGSESAARDVESLARDCGYSLTMHRLDVISSDAISAFFSDTIKPLGHFAVLVNNAGITRDSLLIRMKDEDFDAVLDVNLRGAFLCLREASKIMMKQRYGRIINISSVVGEMGNAGQCNYAAAKAGLIGLTKSAAKELAPRAITVNAITPGFIETDMTSALSEETRKHYIQAIPLGRFGTVEEVAHCVSFLADENSGYITGQIFGINGGLYC